MKFTLQGNDYDSKHFEGKYDQLAIALPGAAEKLRQLAASVQKVARESSNGDQAGLVVLKDSVRYGEKV